MHPILLKYILKLFQVILDLCCYLFSSNFSINPFIVCNLLSAQYFLFKFSSVLPYTHLIFSESFRAEISSIPFIPYTDTSLRAAWWRLKQWLIQPSGSSRALMCCQSNGKAMANLNLVRDLISSSDEINQMEKRWHQTHMVERSWGVNWQPFPLIMIQASLNLKARCLVCYLGKRQGVCIVIKK